MLFSQFKQILIWTRDTFLLVADLIRIRLGFSVNKDAYQRLLSSFFLTGGLLNSFGSKFIGKSKFKFRKEGLLSVYSEKQLAEASRQLKNQGYVVFEKILSNELCGEFLKITETIEGVTRVMDGGVGEIRHEVFDRKSPKSVRLDYLAQTLVEQNIVQDIISDPSLLSFAQEYLGSAPLLDLVAMWWHTTYAKSPDKEAAQWFHFDMDRIKWIKFFFYITDVDENSGPHTFVPTSHRNFGIPFKLRRQGYVRLSDETVGSKFPPETWKEFVGKRGTLIVEDTRGLHKGKHCIENDRLLFQLEFTSSGFGVTPPPMKLLKSEMNGSLTSMHTAFPLIYSLCNFGND